MSSPASPVPINSSPMFAGVELVGPSPAHASRVPWVAVGSMLEPTRHVFSGVVSGAPVWLAIADRIVTLLDTEGVARDVRALPLRPLGGPLASGGSKLLFSRGHLLDLEAWTLASPVTDFAPRCLSPSGSLVAGTTRRGYLYTVEPASGRGGPLPVERGAHPLAVTDEGDVVYESGTRLMRYDRARDTSEPICTTLHRSARYVVAPDGGTALVLGSSSVRIVAAGAWSAERTLKWRATAIGFGPDGELVLASDADLLRLRPDGSERFGRAQDARSLAVSADGRVAVGGPRARIEVLEDAAWSAVRPKRRDADAGRTRRRLEGPETIEVWLEAGELRWTGSYRGAIALETPRERSGVSGWWAAWVGVVAPDGRSVALWQEPHPRNEVSVPPDDLPPAACRVELDTGRLRALPIHGPLAFDGDALLGFDYDPTARRLEVVRLRADGGVERLGSPGWSRPLRLCARETAWAVALATGETVMGGSTSPPRRVMHAWAPPDNPHARLPCPARALFVEPPYVVAVCDTIVFVLDHASGELVARHELPHPSLRYRYHEGVLSFLHQDGATVALDVHAGARRRAGAAAT